MSRDGSEERILLDQTEKDVGAPDATWKQTPGNGKPRASSLLYLCMAQGMLNIVLLIYVVCGRSNDSRVATHDIWSKSPGLDLAVDSYHDDAYNWTIYQSLVQRPSEDVEKAWDALHSGTGFLRFSEQEILDAGAELDSAQFPPDFGGGYIGNLDVFHQLHCLKLMYQFNHPEYYHNRSYMFEMSPSKAQAHQDHCIGSLAQVSMCYSDVSIITYDWFQQREGPVPNMAGKRKCRDFGKVKAWAESITVTPTVGDSPDAPIPKPEGILGRPPLKVYVAGN